MTWLWNELHDLFDEDDGSLPEIYVEYQRPEPVVRGYALVRDLAESVVTIEPEFWSNTESASKPLASVDNPAALVVAGSAEPFHVVFGGIAPSGGAIVPDLGIYVFQRELAMDYRMGREWGPEELRALFELFVRLCALEDGARPRLQRGTLPDIEARFRSAWQRFLSERRSDASS